jgi:hypothetical protein
MRLAKCRQIPGVLQAKNGRLSTQGLGSVGYTRTTPLAETRAINGAGYCFMKRPILSRLLTKTVVICSPVILPLDSLNMRILAATTA